MHSEKITQVLVVDDSPDICKILTNTLERDPQIKVVGIAYNGQEAIDLVPKIKPDIIIMDLCMPKMDGFEATKHIMAYDPTPILIFSALVLKEEAEKVFKAISYGALEVINKNILELNSAKQSKIDEFISKIKFLATIKVITHPLGKLPQELFVTSTFNFTKKPIVEEKIIGIVASTGGPKALEIILQKIPPNFPYSILVVQHMTSGFMNGLVEWLNKVCSIKIKIAQHNEKIQPGTVYMAPTDYQMRITEEGLIKITDEEALDGFKPSGTILLDSLAKSYQEKALGIILTGMGSDGALGLAHIKNRGGHTIAEDENAVIFGMPKVAIDMGIVDLVVPKEKIADEILK